MELRSDSMFQSHNANVWRAMQRITDHQRAAAGKVDDTNPFVKLVSQGVKQVNEAELDSQGKIEKLLAGEDINQAEVFTSIQKADMSFRLLVQIRNKLQQAFDEINSIRV